MSRPGLLPRLLGRRTALDLRTVQGLAAWYKANLEAGADASAVSATTDQSGNSRPAVQATGGNQPTLRHNILNGRKVYRFDGSDRLIAASWGLVQPCTVFIVGKNNLGTAGNLCDGSNVAQNTMVVQVGAANFSMYAGAFLHDGARNSNFQIIVAVFSGAASKLWVAGGAAATGNPAAGAPGGVSLGATQSGGTPLTGEIAEFAVFGSALSAADANLLGAYAASEYALAWATAT